MKAKIINDKVIQCECGFVVKGKSKKHTESNLNQHKKSKKHKSNLEAIK